MVLVSLLMSAGTAFGEGLYLQAAVGAGELDGRPVGELGLRLGTKLTPWLDGGAHAAAFHTLEREYEDAKGRTYQAESGYTALYLRPHLGIGERVELGITLQSGTGLLQYRYTREYREELVWTEELLDSVTFGMYAAGLDLTLRLCPVHAITLGGGYRGASPLRTPYADNGDWNSPYVGLSYTWKLL
jgi:hypothetical protein